jgi:hypothetical protein
VPHVAFDTITHAFSHKLSHSGRPPQASDRAQTTAFESLLDQSAPSTTDRPPAADDNASQTGRSDRNQPDARAEDDTAAKSNDDAKTESKSDSKTDSKSDSKPAAESETQPADADKDVKAGKTDKPDDDNKTTDDSQAAADTMTAEQAANIDGSTPVSDGKPADGPVVATAVVAPAVAPTPAPTDVPEVDTIPKITTTDTITTDVAPTPELAPEPTDDTKSKVKAAPAADTAAIDVNAIDANAIDANAKSKPDKLADLHSDADKSAEDANSKAKAAPQLHTDAKPHVATEEPDKDAAAHARGEVSSNGNRGATVDAPSAINAESHATAPNTGIDAGQTAALTAPSPNTMAPAAANLAVAAQLAPQAAPIPLAGVAIEIASKALNGKNNFEIRLDPPELGRIEVRLSVDRDGNVTSRLIADRSDTLDLLRRDASGLERALQDAGLKTSDNGLQFSLRDQSTGREQTDSGANTARIVVEDEMLSASNATPREYGRLAGQGSGIDIHV